MIIPKLVNSLKAKKTNQITSHKTTTETNGASYAIFPSKKQKVKLLLNSNFVS